MSPFLVKISLTVLIIFSSLLFFLKSVQKEDVGLIINQPKGRLRQHGDYWVWHDYILSGEMVEGNNSITLTTHATYMDLGMLPDLLKRWNAPISLAIFACGDDFDKTIRSLQYLNKCVRIKSLMRSWVNIHLVFHTDYIPENLNNADILAKVPSNICKRAPFEQAQQDLTFWHTQKLIYPVNLLRNVARSNAATYYILAVDIELLPSTDFVRNFLATFWLAYKCDEDVPKPYRTVFCVPTFAQICKDSLLETKAQLLDMLRNLNTTQPIYNDPKVQKQWLATGSKSGGISIFDNSRNMSMCVAYVSINEMEPLYDERCEMESIYELGDNLKGKVLLSLNYTFTTLDGAFLIRRPTDSWSHIDRSKTSLEKTLLLWLNWYQFYNDFVTPKKVQSVGLITFVNALAEAALT